MAEEIDMRKTFKNQLAVINAKIELVQELLKNKNYAEKLTALMNQKEEILNDLQIYLEINNSR